MIKNIDKSKNGIVINDEVYDISSLYPDSLINLISEFKLFNEVSSDTLDKKISNKSLSTY